MKDWKHDTVFYVMLVSSGIFLGLGLGRHTGCQKSLTAQAGWTKAEADSCNNQIAAFPRESVYGVYETFDCVGGKLVVTWYEPKPIDYSCPLGAVCSYESDCWNHKGTHWRVKNGVCYGDDDPELKKRRVKKDKGCRVETPSGPEFDPHLIINGPPNACWSEEGKVVPCGPEFDPHRGVDGIDPRIIIPIPTGPAIGFNGFRPDVVWDWDKP